MSRIRKQTFYAKGRIKRVHVDKKVIAANLKHGSSDPPITIQFSNGSIKCYGVTVFGVSEFVYRPHQPLSCGARLWIETTAEIMVRYLPAGKNEPTRRQLRELATSVGWNGR